MYLVMYLHSAPLCLHQRTERKVFALEKKLAELKEENQPLAPILKQIFQALSAEGVRICLANSQSSLLFLETSSLCRACLVLRSVALSDQNLDRALELKQQYEDEMTVGTYVTLMNHCCRHDNVEEALNLKREM